MDVKNIIEILHKKIDTISDTEEALVLCKAIERLQLGSVKIVNTYADLLTMTDVQNYEVYFVEDEEFLYYHFDGDWILITNYEKNLILAWGNNGSGRLGDGTTTSRSSPVSVIGGFTDWIQVSAGNEHSLGLRSNGTVWAWGDNASGRLGDGTITHRSSPVPVVGGFTNWIQASAGWDHSLGLRANGTLWAWGDNASGRLGDGTSAARSSPVSVIGGFTDWIYAGVGAGFSIGLRANGTAWAWGAGGVGRLGSGSDTNTTSPVSVVGGFTDWIQLSTYRLHTVGVRANGDAWAWGFNGNGVLGDNTTTNRNSPVSVVGGFTNWIQASAGWDHSLGLRANGTVWAWGAGANGKLGTNNTTNRSSPVAVVGGFTNWISVDGGEEHSVGVRVDGTAWAWGLNTEGQLGDGTTTNRSSPVSVVGGFANWISASAGENFSLAIRSSE